MTPRPVFDSDTPPSQIRDPPVIPRFRYSALLPIIRRGVSGGYRRGIRRGVRRGVGGVSTPRRTSVDAPLSNALRTVGKLSLHRLGTQYPNKLRPTDCPSPPVRPPSPARKVVFDPIDLRSVSSGTIPPIPRFLQLQTCRFQWCRSSRHPVTQDACTTQTAI